MGDLLCPFCRGEMEIVEQFRHNRGVAAAAILLGILSFFFISPLIGALLLVIGLFMAFSKRYIWLCNSCSSAIERFKKRS